MPAHLAELEFVAELLESTDRPEWGKHVRLAIAEISALRAAQVGVNVGVEATPSCGCIFADLKVSPPGDRCIYALPDVGAKVGVSASTKTAGADTSSA